MRVTRNADIDACGVYDEDLEISLEEAVEHAKEYISDALSAMLDLGAGSGPMNHAFDLKDKYL